MKLSIVSFALLAASVNGQNCPTGSGGGVCTSDSNPVVCGNNFACKCANCCAANFAGYTKLQCLPKNTNGCPVPGTGSSKGVPCTADESPVMCGPNDQCIYANECIANAVGFLSGCKALPTGGTPSNPIQTYPKCPIPGTGSSTGTVCTADESPVRCGLYDHCVYANECIANSVGFLAGCKPVAKGEPVNPIEAPPANLPTSTSTTSTTSPTKGETATYSSSGAGRVVTNLVGLAVAAFSSAAFLF